jgi:agmatine deiminase
MVTDNETNLLYLADCLPEKYPLFSGSFLKLLERNSIPFKFLPNTKDIWAVDYMPLQLAVGSFLTFIYNPDYLQTKAGMKTISDVPGILKETGIVGKSIDLVLDGGNVVKSKGRVILCDKIFRENPQFPERMLIKKLDKVIFLPTQKSDFTGHADGMVRFIDEETVLINTYADGDRDFSRAVIVALNNAGLATAELAYNPYQNTSNNDASGIYMNYLEMEGLIILPTFDLQEDEAAVHMIGQLFPHHKILTFNSSEIAKKGGILNCISWNIKV